MTTENITDTTDKTKRPVRDDFCPQCGSDDLEGDFVSSGGDSAIQEMYCRNCYETWENHYSFDGMSFPVTNEVVYVESETERRLAAEIERLGTELSIARRRASDDSAPAKISVENGSDDDPCEIDADDIDKCPYCGTANVDRDGYEERIFEDSGYFPRKCYECKGTWTLAGTIDRVILDP